VQLEKTKIKPDDAIQIINGPLMNLEGTVLEVHQKTIKVILPSLGHALVAQVEKASVEVISTKEATFMKELSAPSIKNFKIA
jgi:transcription antitermination factor NusG